MSEQSESKNPSIIMQDIPLKLRGYKLCKFLFKRNGLSGLTGLIMSGKNFNEITQSTPMYKALTFNEKHNGYQFVVGRNVDTQPFKTDGCCCPGGIYFSDKNNIRSWSAGYSHVRQVLIPDDAQVYIESCDKAKTSIIMLGCRKYNDQQVRLLISN